MKINRVIVGQLETNCWVIDDGSGVVAVIDPGDDTNAINEVVGSRTVAAVVLTHGHFDHMGSADEVTDDNSSFLWAHGDEVEALKGELGRGGEMFGVEVENPSIDRTVIEGGVIEVGRLKLKVIHTPGHTPGSMCLMVTDPDTGENHLFSGDMLFAGSVGRTDLPGSMPEVMDDSMEKLAELGIEATVYPGHGPTTTLSREAAVNPFWPSY